MPNRTAVTLQAGQLRQAKTRPVDSAEHPAAAESTSAVPDTWAWSGRPVLGCRVGQVLAEGGESTVYQAQDAQGRDCVLKRYKDPQRDRRAIYQRLQELQPHHMPQLLAYGMVGGQLWECMERVPGRCLAEEITFSEQELRAVLLPQLVHLLQELHAGGLLHNDLKPENLVWDASTQTLYLVDFGNMTGFAPQLERGLGVTLSYVAPEILTSLGKAWSAASDVCALGLTLYTLLTGQRLVPEANLFQTKLCWQREMPYAASLSDGMRRLLRSMLQPEPKDRPDESGLLHWIGETEQVAAPQRPAALTVHFRDGELTTAEDLRTAALQDWEQLSFLLQQHQLDAFLRQFRKDAYELCSQCIRQMDPDAGLFELLQTFCPGREIVWHSRCYPELAALLPEQSELTAFCCAGALSVYCSSNGYTSEQITYAQQLEDLMRKAPALAARQLELALGVRLQFTCGGQQIGTLAELTARLQAGASDLDACVQELVQADGFAAWMAGQGLEAVLPRARAWAAVMEENEAAARRDEPV